MPTTIHTVDHRRFTDEYLTMLVADAAGKTEPRELAASVTRALRHDGKLTLYTERSHRRCRVPPPIPLISTA